MVEPIQNNVGEANQIQSSSTSVAPESTPAAVNPPAATEVAKPASAQAPEKEKYLPQSEVNEIVGKVKREAAEKAKREAILELQKATAASPAIPPVQNTGSTAQGNVDPQQLAYMVQQQAQLQAQQYVGNAIASEFMSKIDAAKQKDPNFEKDVLAPLNYGNLPIPLVQILNSVDNTPEVMKEMAENPSKFADVMNNFHWGNGNPTLANKAVKLISDSIKQNAAAKAAPQAPEPLSQIKPSTTGTDNGSLSSVRDYRNQSWLRG